MRNDEEKNEGRKKIAVVCGLLGGILAWAVIWMSQGAFDSIFLGSSRAEEQKRQEMMKILEESLSESMAASVAQSEEELPAENEEEGSDE